MSRNHAILVVPKENLMIPNLNKKPEGEHKLFFGEHDLARLDTPFDPKFKALAEVDEANVWFLNVVDCSNDRWYEYPKPALTKFQLTVGYQTVMDATVPDIFSKLGELATDPWLGYLYSRVSTMEKTHNLSYSSGILQAFGAKAQEFLNVVYQDEQIKHRVDDEVAIATEFINSLSTWQNDQHHRRLLLKLLLTVFFLEGVKFPFSFFTTWTLNKAYSNCSQGFSQLLLLIAHDEMSVHTATGSNVISKLLKHPDFTDDVIWFKTYASKYFTDGVTKEIRWSNYLLETGEEPGFNEAINTHFIRYWADRRLTELKLPTLFNIKKNDIEIWFDEYRNINGKQSALQEVSNISYQIAQCMNDLHRFDKN